MNELSNPSISGIFNPAELFSLLFFISCEAVANH